MRWLRPITPCKCEGRDARFTNPHSAMPAEIPGGHDAELSPQLPVPSAAESGRRDMG
jgi:hypothetical protein